MTEFIVSARLVADASGLKAGAAEGAAAIGQLKRQAESAGDGAARLRSASATAGSAVDGLAGRSRQGADAVRTLSHRVGDAAQSMVAAAAPALGLAQRVGGAGDAATAMGSKIGMAGALLRGPWGAAVDLAVVGLTALIGAFVGASEQTDRSRDATDLHKMSLRELTDAIREHSRAVQQQIQTSRQSELQAIATAQAQRDEVLTRRAAALATLEQARAEAQLAAQISGGAGDSGLAAQAIANQRVRELEAQIAAAEQALRQAEANVGAARIPMLRRAANERNDPSARIQNDYDRALERATGQLNWDLARGMDHQQAERRYGEALDRAARERDSATEQLQRERQERRRRPRAEAGDLTTFDRPVGGTVTSGFGPRRAPATGGGRVGSSNHPGVDLAARVGDSVRAPADGVVLRIGNDPSGYGLFVDVDHGAGTVSRVAHLSSNQLVREGQRVSRGDVIGRAGQSGNASGPHVHYEVRVNNRVVNPLTGRFRTDSAAVGERADDSAERAEQQRLRQLEQDLQSVTRHFGGAAQAAAEFNERLEQIARLEAAGQIGSAQALEYRLRLATQRAAAEEAALAALIPDDGLRQVVDSIPQRFGDQMEEEARRAAEALEQRGTEAVDAIASLFGRRMGRITSAFGDLLFARGEAGRVDARAFGGLGGLLNVFRSERSPHQVRMMSDEERAAAGADPYAYNPLLDGLREVFDPLRDGLRSLLRSLDGLFGNNGSLTKVLGRAAGYAFIGGSVATMAGGSGLGGSIGGAAGGLLGNMAGKAIGGMLGQAAGPLGSILGGLAGGAIGNLIAGSKRGSATISGLDGMSTGGNSASRIAATTGLAKTVQGALAQIAEELGGTVGSFSGSIGQRNDKFVVDPTGRGRTRGSGVLKFATEEEAVAALLADVIGDGAIGGISAAVRAALGSSSDVQKALREALKVDEVEGLVAGLGGALSKQFRDFERQAQERVRIARQYGFDVVKIEQINAEERARLVDQVLAGRVGALKELLQELSFGSLFEGSMADRRSKLLGELGKARAEAEQGVDGAADRQARLSRELVQLSREAFGTAGPEFASDRQQAITSAERVIQLENDRVRIAQEQAQQTNRQLGEVNDQLAVGNAIQRQALAALEAIARNTGGGGGGGGVAFADTGRFTELA